MPIVWKGADAANYRAGRASGFQPQAIVIHIMEGTLTGTDAWFNDPHAHVSAHYGVGRAGEVHQYVKETDTALHAGVVDKPTWTLIKPRINPNFYTIGIEHEGMGDAAWPWPAPQLATSVALVRNIAARWAIPADADHIVPHHAIRASKTCPGVHFDLADYVSRLAQQAAAAPTAAAPAAGTVNTMSKAHVRSAPTTAAAVLRLLPANAAWAVSGVVAAGEPVRGNALWYLGETGGYVWAGATDRPNGL